MYAICLLLTTMFNFIVRFFIPWSNNINFLPENISPRFHCNLAVLALFLSFNSSAALVAEYDFSGNLKSNISGAADLVYTSEEFSYLECGTGQAFQFPAGAGLQLDTSGLNASDSYTLSILFEFNQTSGFRKILDFKNKAEDAGLYTNNGAMEFFPVGSSGNLFDVDTFVQLVITRDNTGNLIVYLDGAEAINVQDEGAGQIGIDNVLSFFLDDITTTGEASGGTVASIAIYDDALSSAQVQGLTPVTYPSCAGIDPLFPQIPFCNANAGNFEFGPWHIGRINRIKLEVGLEEQISDRQIRDFLFMADASSEFYSDTFGWPYTLPFHATAHWSYPGISGAGTGDGGTCWSPGFLGLLDEESGDDFGTGGQTAEPAWLDTVIHELLHQWDGHGSLWLQGPDTAHSFTEAFQPWVNAQFGWHYLATHLSVFGTLPAQQGLDWIEGLQIDRYINDPSLSWDTYFSDEAYELARTFSSPVPKDYERLGIQGAFVARLMRLHGVEAMQGVWDLIEAYRLTEPDIASLTPDDINRNFIQFIGDGLELDISEYLDYWKFPVPDDLRTHLSQYPPSPMLSDGDGDGVDPWHGDYDDTRADVFPGAEELLDGIDNNLNGVVDEQVVTESGNDFPASTAITVPAVITGEISDLLDVDTFTFTLAETSLVSVQTQTIRADMPRELDGRIYERTIATVRLDGSFANWIEDIFRGGSERTFAVEAGAHTLEIGTWDEFSNPGEYEVQIFINGYTPPPLDLNDGTYDFKIYTDLKAGNSFDCTTVNDMTSDQCEGLVALQSKYGDQWADARGWLKTPDACYWRGVFCNKDGVSRLILDSNRLTNGAPPEASDLPFPALRQLMLNGNRDGHTLSDPFGHLTELRQMSLAHNNVSGTLPESLGSLSHLTTIMLNNNQFSGELPEPWANATALKHVEIQNNNLSGAIPTDWRKLKLDTFHFDAESHCVNPVIEKWLATIENVTPGPYTSCPFEINAGLNDAWVNANAPFQGMFVTVFPVLKLIFTAWFTFDSEIPSPDAVATIGAPDQRWITALGSFSDNQADLKAELTTGGLFNTSIPTPSQDTNYGTINLEFSDCNLATVDFDFPSAEESGSFTLQRVVESNVPQCEVLNQGQTAATTLAGPQSVLNVATSLPQVDDQFQQESKQAAFIINSGLNDAWVSADANFQGLFFTVFEDLNLFFLSWFTFDSVAQDESVIAKLGAPDQRWITGAAVYSGNTVTVNAELTSGGLFNGSEPMASQTPGYGTITVVFKSCNEATLTYDFPGAGLSGEMSLSRVISENVALCEAQTGS